MTKEIQDFLHHRRRGEQGDKSLSFEQEIEILKDTYERIINDKKTKIRDLQKQINAVAKENKHLDEHIESINVDVCEIGMEKDHDLDKLEQYVINNR